MVNDVTAAVTGIQSCHDVCSGLRFGSGSGACADDVFDDLGCKGVVGEKGGVDRGELGLGNENVNDLFDRHAGLARRGQLVHVSDARCCTEGDNEELVQLG